jgi:hypothetical protein
MMVEKRKIEFLEQLIEALEKAAVKLEQDYRKKDYASYSNTRKFILNVQKKISEVTVQ